MNYREGTGMEQRMEALELANRVRIERARIKRDLAAGRMTLAQAVASPWCRTARLVDLLLAQPKWGRVKSFKMIRRLGIVDTRTVGSLTMRHRRSLLAETDVIQARLAVSADRRARATA